MSFTRVPWLGRRSSVTPLEIEVSAHLPALGQLAAQLTETSQQVERAVTQVCGTFQDMVGRAQAGLAHAEAISGGAAPTLTGAATVAAASTGGAAGVGGSRTASATVRITGGSASASVGAVSRRDRGSRTDSSSSTPFSASSGKMSGPMSGSAAASGTPAGAGQTAGGQGIALLDTLTGARQAFDVLLDRLTSASARARDAADRVEQLRELAAGVEKGIAKVDSIAMSVRLLALNAKIEAARDGDRGAGFSVVASEMERCAGESSDIADSIQSTARELTSTLNGVAETLRAEADRASEDMHTSRRAIEEALRDVERTHEAVRTHLAEAGRMNRGFTRDISAAVVALQFQDRVSQRVAHVVEGLARMHDALAAALPARRDADHRIAQRRDEVQSHLAGAHTMHEERLVTTPPGGAASQAGHAHGGTADAGASNGYGSIFDHATRASGRASAHDASAHGAAGASGTSGSRAASAANGYAPAAPEEPIARTGAPPAAGDVELF